MKSCTINSVLQKVLGVSKMVLVVLEVVCGVFKSEAPFFLQSACKNIYTVPLLRKLTLTNNLFVTMLSLLELTKRQNK